MQTHIFTSRKLEKIISKYILEEDANQADSLGGWSAQIFYVYRKKCWLIVNKSTKYVVILNDIKQADLQYITTIFQDAFYDQLVYDGILFDYNLVKKLIGEVKLCKTDNDRSTIGTINDCIDTLKYWINEYDSFENMPFHELNSRLNSQPNRGLGWEFSKDKMMELIISLTSA